MWVFQRDSEALRLEILYDDVKDEFVLVFRNSSGGERTERFKDTTALQSRLIAVNETFDEGRWQRACAAISLDDRQLLTAN